MQNSFFNDRYQTAIYIFDDCCVCVKKVSYLKHFSFRHLLV